MTRIVRQLRVWLGAQSAGRLMLDDTARCTFQLDAAYRLQYPRPVLGQQFEDDPAKTHHARSRLPAWFANLLPEGALRELVERDVGRSEFELLEHLGHDLPGAVRAVPEMPGADAPGLLLTADTERHLDRAPNTWHFSLAGVQLKFSAQRTDRGMTVPAAGRGGDWILKLPDLRFSGVPFNEYATMRWAAASGIETPEVELVPLDRVSGLPAAATASAETHAFAVRRFDRPVPGQRVHMEDFAQVLGLFPHEKFARFNYETIARVILALAGDEGLSDFIHRLVFMLASGNGDAHHKNWSLLYPDGLHPVLSPAYDQLATFLYFSGEGLALNLGGSKRWEDANLDAFRRLARKIDIDEIRVLTWTQQAVANIRQAWREQATDLGYAADAVSRLDKHMARVPLLSGR
jgi:serine/threonine-protein kinase HipA